MTEIADAMDVVRGFSRNIWRTVYHPAVSDAWLLAVSQYVATAFGFLTTVIAARLLGPGEYGIAAIIMAYPTVVWSFAAVKTIAVTTRYISIFHATGRNGEIVSMCKLGYSLDLIASIIALSLVGATAWWIGPHLLNVSEAVWLMLAFAASFPVFSLTGTSLAILTSWSEFRWLAGLQIVNKGLTFVIVLAFLFAGWGVPGVVLGNAMGQVLNGLMLSCVATRVLSRDGIGLWWNAPLGHVALLQKELTAFFGWNYLVVSLSGVIGLVPVLLLGRFRTPEEAGFYRLATSLTTAGSYLESSLGQVIYPRLSVRRSEVDGERLSMTLRRWTLRAGLPVGVFVLLTVSLLPIMFPLLLGPGYSAMVLGAQVMMAGAAVSALFFWVTSCYYAAGKIGQWSKAYSFYTAIVVGSAWFCVARWGFTGLAGLVALGKVLFTLLMVAVFLNTKEWHEHLPVPKTR
jgi:O-antigen/teichoic acid export membrane protein